VILKNLTRKTIIFDNIKVASSYYDNLFGLLQQDNQAMIFNTRFGIHTFGIKEKIDVFVLDKDSKVVKMKTVSPNNLFFWNPKYNMVIELPKGTLSKSKTKIGDVLFLAKK